MSGTREGAIKTVATIRQRYGAGFYEKIGHMGGKAGRGPNCLKGFAADRERARVAGSLGGKISSRAGVKNGYGREAVKDIEEAEKILEQEDDRD